MTLQAPFQLLKLTPCPDQAEQMKESDDDLPPPTLIFHTRAFNTGLLTCIGILWAGSHEARSFIPLSRHIPRSWYVMRKKTSQSHQKIRYGPCHCRRSHMEDNGVQPYPQAPTPAIHHNSMACVTLSRVVYMTQEISVLSNRVDDLAFSTRETKDSLDQHMSTTTK